MKKVTVVLINEDPKKGGLWDHYSMDQSEIDRLRAEWDANKNSQIAVLGTYKYLDESYLIAHVTFDLRYIICVKDYILPI